MNINRDHLDEAIDHVAKRLTHVEDDAVFASRVVASLPARTTWFGWLTHSWAPRLAMIAVVALGAALWNARRTTESPVRTATLAGVPTVSEPSTFVASATREPLAPVRTTPVERLEPMEPLEPFVGLPSVEAPAALALNEVTPAPLADGAALSLPSLVIAELPLTAESFPQRD